MTEKVLPQLQAAAMEFLRYVYGVILHEKLCSCEHCKTFNVESLL